MSRRVAVRCAIALCIVLCPFVLGAQTKTKSSKPGKKAPVVRGPRFSGRDRDTISKYFHNPYSNLPPVMKNGGTDVPPNLRKQLVPSATLPPELQPRALPLPPPLERRLAKLAKPYQRAVVGPDVIIFDRKTQRITDVMVSVLIPAHTGYN